MLANVIKNELQGIDFLNFYDKNSFVYQSLNFVNDLNDFINI